MSQKKVLDFAALVVDESMGASVTTAASNILYTDRVGYQISWTGTPTGAFTVEISNDETTWVELTLSTPITASGSADDAFIDAETAAKFIRLVYTRTSGTGTLNVHITAKSISA